MHDNKKTKAQLITELEEMRLQVAGLKEEQSQPDHAAFHLLAETAASAIFIFQDSVFRYTNPATSALTGYSAEELLGSNIWNLVHPEHRDLLKERLEAWHRGEPVPPRSEFKIVTRNGDTRWIDADSTFIRFDGRAAALTIAYDSTGHKRTEEELSASEQRYRRIIETAQEAIWVVDAEALTTDVNPHLADMLGYTREELLGRSVFDFVDKSDRSEAARYLERGKSGSKEQHDFRFRRKDGSALWTMVSSTPLFDGSGSFVGGLAMLIDITDRKRAEEQLVKAQERLQHVLSFSPAIIYLLQIKDGKFITEWVSESLKTLTGHEQSEALADGWWTDHIHPDDRARVIAELPRVFTGDRLDLEYRFRHKDGGYLWLHNESRLLRDQSGDPVEVVGSWVDVTERREAEVALRDSEERFRTLVSSMDDMVFTVDLDHRHTGAFGSWVEKLGFERRDLIGKTASEIFGVDTAQIHEEAYAQALAGEPVIYEWSMATETETRHFQTSLSPIRDQSGKVTGLVGVGRDGTERKRAGEALLASEERYRELVENARDIIYTHDLMGNYTSVNKAAELITGYTRDEALTMNLDQTVAPEYLDMARQMISRNDRQKEAVYDLEIIAKDGRRIMVEVNTRLVVQGDVPVGIQGIARDVTERKRADEALRDSQERFRRYFELGLIGMAITSPEKYYLEVNDQLCLMLAYERSELLQMTWSDVTHPDDVAADVDQFNLVLAGELDGYTLDKRFIRKDGQVIHSTISVKCVRCADGSVDYFVALTQDITERKEAERARKRADDLLRRQTAQLAALHEIGLKISAESELSRVLDVATRRAAELLNSSHCSVYIRDRERGELNLVASLDGDLIGMRIKEGEGLAGRVAESGDPLAIDDYREWSGRASIFDDKSFGPSLGVPLKWQHTVIGVISLSRTKGSEQFTNADLEFLEQIAAEVAIAVHQTTLFEEVQEGQRRLQVLSHRLIDAQEAERKRLARELHDQIGQALTAVQISLQTMQPSTQDGSAKLLEDSLVIIDEAIQQVHDLSLDLRPSLLDDLGLVAALRWYVGRVASRAGLAHAFKVDGMDTRLAPEVETACFRIAQEALTNVLRHANATNVSVTITSGKSDLRLLVRDNGVGFDVRAALGRTGLSASLGLQGMQERAAAIGGSVDIRSRPRRGTKVQATLLIKRTASS